MIQRLSPVLLGLCCAAAVACKPDPKCAEGFRLKGNACDRIAQGDASVEHDAATDAGDGDRDGGPRLADGSTGDAGPGFCLVDSDHDGFGVEGVVEPCPSASTDAGPVHVVPGDCNDSDEHVFPEAPIDRCDGKDNDCDKADEPPVDEVCNGLDDDCKGGVDNGVANACGLCGDLPAETCNAIDDDCDGLTDPNMSEKVAEAVVTQPGGGSSYVGASLVERAGGGAWLLYNGAASATAGNTVRARRITEDGKLDDAPPIDLATATAEFVADSDGKWVVVLSRKLPSGDLPPDSEWARLQLFNADDMSFVSETILLDSPSCGVTVRDVAVLQDSEGRVEVATVYGQGTSCGKTFFAVQTYEGPWNSNGRIELPNAYSLAIERIPCREEWLMVRGTAVEKYSLLGTLLNPSVDTVTGGGSLVLSLQRGSGSCIDGAPTMTFARGDGGESGGQPYLRQWSVNPQDGSIARLGTDVTINYYTMSARLAQAGGRWFASVGGVSDFDGKPHLYEIAFGASDPVRDIPIVSVPGAYPGATKRGAGEIIGTNGVVVHAIASNWGNLETYRSPGDTDPPVAVTYKIGCP